MFLFLSGIILPLSGLYFSLFWHLWKFHVDQVSLILFPLDFYIFEHANHSNLLQRVLVVLSLGDVIERQANKWLLLSKCHRVRFSAVPPFRILSRYLYLFADYFFLVGRKHRICLGVSVDCDMCSSTEEVFILSLLFSRVWVFEMKWFDAVSHLLSWNFVRACFDIRFPCLFWVRFPDHFLFSSSLWLGSLRYSFGKLLENYFYNSSTFCRTWDSNRPVHRDVTRFFAHDRIVPFTDIDSSLFIIILFLSVFPVFFFKAVMILLFESVLSLVLKKKKYISLSLHSCFCFG